MLIPVEDPLEPGRVQLQLPTPRPWSRPRMLGGRHAGLSPQTSTLSHAWNPKLVAELDRALVVMLSATPATCGCATRN